MFPPQATEDVKVFIENLLSSLVRGGLETTGDICLDEIEDQKYSVMVRAAPVTKPIWAVFKNYVQQYSLASGWRIEKLRQMRGAVVFVASRA